MKKIFALALAAVMTAGMTTVAFAAPNDETPVVGVNADETSVLDSAVTPYTDVFVIDENGDAASKLSALTADETLEGGDEIAIPIAIRVEGSREDRATYYWFDRDYDYKTSNVKAYADWDDVEGDAEGEVDYRWVKYTDSAFTGEYIYSVVVTVPENNGDKVLDLVGKVSVGRTTTSARNAKFSVSVATEFAPDGTKVNYPSTTNFDGGILDAGVTGIVSFDKTADEIDIEFGEQALFTVDVTGQGKLNLAWNTKFNKEFAAMYDYANLDFLTFEGEPAFNRTGDFYIYADEDAFVYEVTADGAKALDATWDEDYEAWKFRTRSLTSYVISDVELDEKTVTEDNTSSTTDGGKENPDTGR